MLHLSLEGAGNCANGEIGMGFFSASRKKQYLRVRYRLPIRSRSRLADADIAVSTTGSVRCHEALIFALHDAVTSICPRNNFSNSDKSICYVLH